MPDYTTHLNLVKPDGSESVDVDQLNANSDTIDTNIFNILEALDGHSIVKRTSGLSASAGWTLDVQTFYRFGPLIHFRYQATRTGASIAGGATGDATNSQIAVWHATANELRPYDDMYAGNDVLYAGQTHDAYINLDGLALNGLGPGNTLSTGQLIMGTIIYFGTLP